MVRFLLWSIALLLVIGVSLRLFERHLVFFPSKYPSGFWEPNLLGLQVQEVWLTTSDDTKIHAWFVAQDSACANVVMAHGNAGNLSDRVEWLELLHQNVPANFMMFDYRGYGRSEGTPSEEGCYRDAEAAHDWLRQEFPDLPIIAHGHSLGGAVMIELANRRTVQGLIIESSFTDARDMARLMFGPLPVYWLTGMKWASIDKVARLKMPKLFIHGDRDRVIPYALGQKLYAHAAEPKQFVTLRDTDHNDTYLAGGELYFQTIKNFVLENASAKIQISNTGLAQ
ncbi:MAG: alpha/beta hydrolase [bacterium]